MPSPLLDTHAVIWYLLASARIPNATLELIEGTIAAGKTVGVSTVSVVEIVYLTEKGRIPHQAQTALAGRVSTPAATLGMVAVTYDIARAVERVPREQLPDMPDRIIAATALHLGVPLVSHDRKIRLSAVATVW
jgi:PIN domain nuclease of toxin-antitoxin system